MKKVASLAVFAAFVLMVAGVATAGECKGKKGGGGFFTKADTDKDGKLTLAEFKGTSKDAAKAEARFQAADADKDGFVTAEELKAAHPKKGAKAECAKPAPEAAK